MQNALRQHIIARLGDNPDNLEEVLSYFTPIKAKRNQVLLMQGDVCKHVYYIAKGCLQVFVYDVDGNETTRDIVTEDNWCSELISFGTQQLATENIRCVEPSELYAIDGPSFQKLMETVPQFNLIYKQVLEASYANSVYRINTFVALTALDRIKWLMEYRPKLMARLSSKLIASYLGISQETFSRLKGKL
jgi:CRP-like cAMP-binding protein